MIGIVILADRAIGDGLLATVTHIFGERPPAIEVVAVDDANMATRELEGRLQRAVSATDHGAGVLVLADVFGATHTSTAQRLRTPARTALVTGVNVPMLLRALNYRGETLSVLARRAASGGREGIVTVSSARRTKNDAA